MYFIFLHLTPARDDGIISEPWAFNAQPPALDLLENNPDSVRELQKGSNLGSNMRAKDLNYPDR